MWELSALWELAQKLGSAGFVLVMLLYLDERRERRQVQALVARMHRDNTKRLEQLLRKTSRASDANGRHTAGSRRGKRRSMQ